MMIQTTKSNTVDFKELVAQGAALIDVREPKEFSSGSVPGAINIPLAMLPFSLDQLNTEQTIIVFCLSGGRSGQAKMLLDQRGFKKVHNGGGWQQLRHNLFN